MNMRKQLMLAAFLLAVCRLQAQNLELGLWGGGALYSGDLSPYKTEDYLDEFGPAGGIFMRLNTSPALSFRLGLSLGRVAAEDGVSNEREDRGLNFRSNITELAFTGEWNVVRLGQPRGLQFTPYLFAGASVFRFNPEARLEDNYIELQPLGTEGQGLEGYEEPYSLTQVALPFGGGFKFIFKERFTIGLEFGSRKTFTDYLDDVSSSTVNYLDVLSGNGSLAAQLSNPSIKDPEIVDFTYVRGGDKKDWYFFTGLTFSFAFGEGAGGGGLDGRGLGCPTNF